MKKVIMGLLAAGVVCGSMATTAFADPLHSPDLVEKQISVNHQELSHPYARVEHGTTYMPIWYVGKAMETIPGVTQSWNGTKHVWTIHLPENHHGIIWQFFVGEGNTAVVADGHRIKQVNTFAAIDPASDKLTTYMPIFYVQEIMRSMGIQNTWDGHDWDITQTHGH